jgi:hypothetical protein
LPQLQCSTLFSSSLTHNVSSSLVVVSISTVALFPWNHNEMRFPALSVSYCLAWSIASSTTRAFSTAVHHPSRYGQSTLASATFANPRLGQSALSVASTDTIAVADMERGVGGRIEAAFEAAKEKGEAAFVSFITAGYPTAQGTTLHNVP